MRIRIGLLSLSLATAGATAIVSAQEDSIVLIHEVRIAFYEHAPRPIERSMRNAIREYCSRFEASSSSEEPSAPWFCEQRDIVYFRSVNVLGHQSETGFVCDEDDAPRNLRYYPEDLFESVTCQWVLYDPETLEYWVEEN